MIDQHHGWNVSFKPSFLGFVLSLVLTFAAYRITSQHHLHNSVLIWTVLGLGALQMFLQLIFFLHLGLESKPHWNSISFLFMVLVIVVVIGGSLWIMSNLNYYLMPEMKMSP